MAFCLFSECGVCVGAGGGGVGWQGGDQVELVNLDRVLCMCLCVCMYVHVSVCICVCVCGRTKC